MFGDEEKMAGYSEGHASKRQRTEGDSYGAPGKRDIYEDPINPSPSQVVHVRGLTDTVGERDLVDALQSFGTISYIMVLTRKRQALVEFEDLNGAMSLVKYAETNPVYVGHKQAHFNYSTSQKIQRPAPGEEKTNNVLLFTILNPKYPITVDVMHTICSANGTVNRVVIFKKNGVQAMVEFEATDAAMRAKQALNGADIYSGCCTLRIEYAKPTRLNVFHNNSDSWDYTNPNPGGFDPMGLRREPQNNGPARNQPLLAEPRYGAAPVPYDNFGPEPPRRGGPPQGPQSMAVDYQPGNDHFDGGYPPRDRYQPPPPHRDNYGHDPYGPPSRNNFDPYHSPPPPSGGPQGPFSDNQGGPGGPPGMYQQGCVLMVYGLHKEKMNASRLFNLFCLYGNVVRIKFLKTKEGSAMIQMGDNISCDRAIKNLHNHFFFESKLQLAFSKQAFLQDVPQPHDLPDGTPSFLDFMGNRNNRFTNPEAAAKNRIQPPSKCLYFWNAPAGITEEQLNAIFSDAGVKAPAKVRQFPSKIPPFSGTINDQKRHKSSTGLLEWDSKGEAVEGLASCNHSEIPNPTGKYPYIFKLCFSSQPIMQ